MMRFVSLLLALLFAVPLRAQTPDGWVAAWASAQMVPAGDQVVPEEWLEDATLRQIVRIGLAGPRLRLRLSNVHGTEPLVIGGATVGRSADNGTSRIEPASLATVMPLCCAGAISRMRMPTRVYCLALHTSVARSRMRCTVS